MSATLDLISETGEAGGEGVAASSTASPLVFASFISTSAMVDSLAAAELELRVKPTTRHCLRLGPNLMVCFNDANNDSVAQW